jgi:CheY-like chemotaxis protein
MPDATSRRDNKSTKILYIEDNPENRVLARAVLEAEGYTVTTADDGLSGIEAAIREQPALILLDVNLPGWTATRRWRSSSRSPTSPTRRSSR